MSMDRIAQRMLRTETQLGRIERIASRTDADVLQQSEAISGLANLTNGLRQDVSELQKSWRTAAEAILEILKVIKEALDGPPVDDEVASVRFVVPTYRDINTGEEVKMALTLANGVISNIPLEFDNLAGTPVPAPDETTAQISTSDPAIASAALGADKMSVDVTPMVPQVAGPVTVSFADSTNPQLAATLDCEYVLPPDVTAANVHFVTAGITTRPLGT